MLNQLLILLADGAPAGQGPAGAPPGGGSLFDNPILFLLPVGIVLFYMLIMRPARQQEKDRQAQLNQTKKNDKIITHSGIYGKVISVAEKEDEIVVEIDDKVRVKMIKGSILRNLTREEELKEADAAKKAAKDAARAGKTGKAPEQPASTAVTTDKKDDRLKF